VGSLNPILTTLSGMLFGALEAGASAMQRDAGVPSVLATVVEASVILLLIGFGAARVPISRGVVPARPSRARRARSRSGRPVTDAIGSFLDATIRTATPLALAALGETVVERAGMINIGLEGTIIAEHSARSSRRRCLEWPRHSPTAVAAGILTAVVLAVFIVSLRADQIVAGQR
jgi:ABC-type uncharacterized transport system permease subunit